MAKNLENKTQKIKDWSSKNLPQLIMGVAGFGAGVCAIDSVNEYVNLSEQVGYIGKLITELSTYTSTSLTGAKLADHITKNDDFKYIGKYNPSNHN